MLLSFINERLIANHFNLPAIEVASHDSHSAGELYRILNGYAQTFANHPEQHQRKINEDEIFQIVLLCTDLDSNHVLYKISQSLLSEHELSAYYILQKMRLLPQEQFTTLYNHHHKIHLCNIIITCAKNFIEFDVTHITQLLAHHALGELDTQIDKLAKYHRLTQEVFLTIITENLPSSFVVKLLETEEQTINNIKKSCQDDKKKNGYA